MPRPFKTSVVHCCVIGLHPFMRPIVGFPAFLSLCSMPNEKPLNKEHFSTLVHLPDSAAAAQPCVQKSQPLANHIHVGTCTEELG